MSSWGEDHENLLYLESTDVKRVVLFGDMVIGNIE